MTDADRIAELEREIRVLRAMLAMTAQQRIAFRRLIAGPATMGEMLDALSAGRREPCSDTTVREQMKHLRRIVPRFGFRIPDNRAGRRPAKGPAPIACHYVLEDLTVSS